MAVSDAIKTTDVRLATLGITSVNDIRGLGHNVMGYSEEMAAKNRELKDFLYQNLYRHWRVMRMASKANHIVTNLFTLFCAEPSLLPHQTQMRIAERTEAGDSSHRVICDYIAGMTDRYALQEYQKLFDPMTAV